MVRALAAAALASLAACDHDAPPPAQEHQQPAPPPGTGTELIDMEGQWMIFAIDRLDAGPAPSGAFLGAPLFLPVQIGQVLYIRDGQLRGPSGRPLYEPSPLDPEDFYANTTDGRVLWFEVQDVEAQPFSQLSVQAVFGSTSGNMIEGFVSIRTMGMTNQGQFLTPSTNGVFQVWAGRVNTGLIYPPNEPILPPIDQPTGVPAAAPTSAR